MKGLDLAVNGVIYDHHKIIDIEMREELELEVPGLDRPPKPLIVIVPGLTSGIEEFYITKMARQALDAGY